MSFARRINSKENENEPWQIYGLCKNQITKANPSKNRNRRNREKNQPQIAFSQNEYQLRKSYSPRDDSSNKYIFLRRFKILGGSDKSISMRKRLFGTQSQRSLGVPHQVQYIRLRRNQSCYNNNKPLLFLKSSIKKDKQQKVNLKGSIQVIKSIQRGNRQNSITTKTTQSISTKPNSLTRRRFTKQNQSDNFIAEQNKPQSLSCLILNHKIIRKEQEIYKSVIPQQQSSQSKSKTFRNYSNIEINSKVSASGRSINPSAKNINASGRSMNASGKSINSISLKNSMKNSIFLPLSSGRKSNNMNIYNNMVESVQQYEGYGIIENYMQFLEQLAMYSQSIAENYQNTEDWQELIFLTYKKYYLNRLKFFHALLYRNTFFFEKNGQKMISSKKNALKMFMNSADGEILRREVVNQNARILQSLRNLYNLIIVKSGNYINMSEDDNFSCEIFRLISQQLGELKENYHHDPDPVKIRFREVIKCCQIILCLDKKYELEKQFCNLGKTPISLALFEKVIQVIRFNLL